MSETCRVSFQNKIEKLVHLVDFVIRTFHDDRSHEPKKKTDTFQNAYRAVHDSRAKLHFYFMTPSVVLKTFPV